MSNAAAATTTQQWAYRWCWSSICNHFLNLAHGYPAVDGSSSLFGMYQTTLLANRGTWM